MSLTQAEFDFIIGQPKQFEDKITPIELGPAPISWSRKILSLNSNDVFLLDFYRGSFELSRFTFNKRYRQTIILFRYDQGGRHTNPDGQTFNGPHIHIYREGFGDKFAFPISEIGILDTDTIESIFNKLMRYSNVSRIPSVELTMF